MSYTSKNWWTEFALFASVTLGSILAAVLFLSLTYKGTLDGLVLIVPSIALGLWAARIYRRRHNAGSEGT
ncbi:hypothetical protein [Streptomyces cyaneofuscatus]|uniref:hypothetical protein n=1 Tax=Streptomyces cyaneofuscatus TaxID=66883 RepID=UPI0033A23C4C